MKTILIILFVGISTMLFAQNEGIDKEVEDTTALSEIVEENEDEKIKTEEIEDLDLSSKTDKQSERKQKPKSDTTKIRIGKKSISVINDGEETFISVIESKDDKDKDFDFEIEDDELKFKKKPSNFKGNWSGFELGLNNFDGNTMDFMELNTGKSFNFNINLFQYSFGLASDYIGLVSGMGFEFNNYYFDNDNILTVNNGLIVPKYSDSIISIHKPKLSTIYATCPLILEFQIPVTNKKSKNIHIGGGVIGGVKLGSKVTYIDKNQPDKIKSKKDYNLSPFRYGITARIGYRSLNLFANYYLTPLFEKSNQDTVYGRYKGPKLNPFTIGLVLVPFD